MSDQTPIPDGDRYVAGVLTELRIEPYISGGKWRFEVDEVQMMALVKRIHDDGEKNGRAAGRTAAAADALMAARDDLVGVADRLRAKARETGDKAHVGMAAGVDLACFRLVELADRAARVAENGPQPGADQ